MGVAVASILFRSPDVELEQNVYPLGLTVDPNPFPGVGLDESGTGSFTFELTVTNSRNNPNLTLAVHVLPSAVQNLSIQHCLENSQPNLSAFNNECPDEWDPGEGTYYANVTSGSSVVLRVRVFYAGNLNEPVTLNWRFYAEETELP